VLKLFFFFYASSRWSTAPRQRHNRTLATVRYLCPNSNLFLLFGSSTKPSPDLAAPITDSNRLWLSKAHAVGLVSIMPTSD